MNYELLDLIGQGAMGRIYRAREKQSGQLVAMKVLLPGKDKESSTRREDALHREVSAIAQMGHRRIVQIFDYGVFQESLGELSAGSPYFTMELARRSLHHGDICSWEFLRAALLQILDGLAHAHAREVLHRDLKPDNLLLRDCSSLESPEELDLCISDFGIAYGLPRLEREDNPERKVQGIYGTPHYMAPEQVRGSWRDWGASTDLYALGCIAYELVSGRPPFEGKSAFAVIEKQVSAPPPTLDAPRFWVPKELELWIHRLLAKDPYRRFARAASAAAALVALDDENSPYLHTSNLHSEEQPEEKRKMEARGSGFTETLNLDELKTRVFLSPLYTKKRPVSAKDTSLQEKQPISRRSEVKNKSKSFPSWWREHKSMPRREYLQSFSLHGLRELPFIGREEERELIWEMLQEAIDQGSPRVVVLRSQSGEGSSALARWGAIRAHELGLAITLFAYHGPGMANERALSSMFAHLMGCIELDEEGLRERIDEILNRYGEPESRGIDERLLYEILSPVALKASKKGPVEPSQERFLAGDRLMGYLARIGPAVMVLDEVQWGSSSLGYVLHLLRSQRKNLPLLMLLSVEEETLEERPAEQFLLEKILEEKGTRVLHLSSLSPADRRALFDEMATFSPGLLQLLSENAQGVPAMAKQLFSWLLEEELLTINGGCCDLSKPVEFPRGLEEVWLRRLESDFSRGQEVECFWLAAALLGYRVDEGEIRAVLARFLSMKRKEVDFDFTELLLEWTGRGLLVRRKKEYFFAQESLRRALLLRLENHPWRARLATCCADYRSSQVKSFATIEDHLQLGRLREVAGDRKGAFWAYAGAMKLYRRTGSQHEPRAIAEKMAALCKPYQSGQEEVPTEEERELEIHRGWLGGSLEFREEGYQALERLREIEARQGRPPSQQSRSIEAFLAGVTGDHLRAAALLEELVEGTTDVVQFRLMERLAWSYSQLGKLDEALQVSHRAFLLEESLGEISAFDRGALRLRLARLLYWVGDRKKALKFLKGAQDAFVASGDPTGLAEVENLRGDLFRGIGALQEAEESYKKAAHFSELAGDSSLVERLNLLIIWILGDRNEEVREEYLLTLWEDSSLRTAAVFQPYIRLAQAWKSVAKEELEAFQFFWDDALRLFGLGVEPDGILIAKSIAELARAKGWEKQAQDALEWVVRWNLE